MTLAGMSVTGYATVGVIIPTHMSIYHAPSEGDSVMRDIIIQSFGRGSYGRRRGALGGIPWRVRNP